MDLSTLRCVLLLPLCLCFDSEVVLEKTIGREPDVTQVCPNETRSAFIFVLCTIRREKSEEPCYLVYRDRENSVHTCDFRFNLIEENQAVFLNLTSFTPEDSGIYSCDCSYFEGTYHLHLNIIVKDNLEEEDANKSTNLSVSGIVISVTIVVIISTVVFGFIYRRTCHGNSSRSDVTSGLSVCETPASLDKDDPYMSLQQPASDLYQTISYSDRNMEAVHGDNQEIDAGEADPSCEIYENI